MATKEEMEKKLNGITELDIKWSRLNKGDLEKLYGIFTERGKLLELGKTIFRSKFQERRGEIKERVKEEVMARGVGLLDNLLSE